MRTGLLALQADYAFELEVLDVDADPVLEARYNELVPVLTADNEELCHYFLDEPKVREYLARFR
jgi:thioredoxin reductase (NADPH)